MSNDDGESRALGPDALFASLGSVERTPTSVLYALGLFVVAAAMVLLPFIYATLIALAAWAVEWHLANDTWILADGGLAVIKALAYLGPAAVGAIVIFFMIKPFIARPSAPADRIALDPASEPVLFALIERICATVGAPAPVRVCVDCSINASASFAGGPLALLRRRLALTIGLPLAAGLTMQQLAGVFAHEFGHFAQGAGMRLTFAIRAINQWFWRVVHERDDWDVRLERLSQRADVRIRIVFWLAKGAVFCSRRVLWALMMLGHLISCAMLRQMEYDADSYEIKISGSDAFCETMAKLTELNVASQFAYRDVRQSWLSGSLPDDFAALVTTKSADLPSELIDRARRSDALNRAGWFDTHPSNAERVEVARRMAQPGIFHRADRAAALFADFNGLSRAVTRHHYERYMRLDVGRVRFIDTDQTLEQSRKGTAAMAALQRLYAADLNLLRPVVVDPAAVGQMGDPAGAWESLQTARGAVAASASKAAVARKAFANLEGQRVRAIASRCLLEAGYMLADKDLGTFEPTTEAADASISRVASEQKVYDTLLLSFERNVGRLLSAGCDMVALSETNDPRPDGDRRREAFRMIQLLVTMNAAYGTVLKLWQRTAVFDYVYAYGSGRQNVQLLISYFVDLERVLRKLVEELRKTIADAPYPFATAGVEQSVLGYFRGPDVTTHDLGAVIQDARGHANLFFELYWRLVGELALIVEQVEDAARF